MKTLEEKVVEKKTIFCCPFYEDCHTQDRKIYWVEGEPLELVWRPECQAPFLYNRQSGDTICRILLESDQCKGWAQAIKDIGRRRG